MNKNSFLSIFRVLSGILILSLGLSIAWGLRLGSENLPIRRYFNQEYTNAVWDWSNILVKEKSDLNDLAGALYMHQINAVYVDISIYESVLENPGLEDRTNDRKKLEKALELYVQTMSNRGIDVYASGGDVSWSDPERQFVPREILKFAQNYNQNYPHAQIKGMQFDIESYNQEGFSEGSNTLKTLVLLDFVNLVDELVEMNLDYTNQSDQHLELGFAIPYWYDNQNGNIPSVVWQGKQGPVLYHILDRLNELPSSNVVVMAYRNAARGNDGVIRHSRTEIDYAAAKTPNVKIIIGQEVSDVEPSKITYYDSTKAELSAQFSYVTDEFEKSGSLGGIAINDLSSFLELPAGE